MDCTCQSYIHTLTRWHVVECGVCRSPVSLQLVGDEQLTETHHDWIVMIVVSKDHPNPSTVAWWWGNTVTATNHRWDMYIYNNQVYRYKFILYIYFFRKMLNKGNDSLLTGLLINHLTYLQTRKKVIHLYSLAALYEASLTYSKAHTNYLSLSWYTQYDNALWNTAIYWMMFCKHLRDCVYALDWILSHRHPCFHILSAWWFGLCVTPATFLQRCCTAASRCSCWSPSPRCRKRRSSWSSGTPSCRRGAEESTAPYRYKLGSQRVIEGMFRIVKHDNSLMALYTNVCI